MAGAELLDQPQISPADAPRPTKPQAWNVVLLNDETHTFDYVIDMLQRVFAMPLARALQVTMQAHTTGRAVCLTTHKEHAELKRDQIHGCGRDWRMASSTGPCRSLIEPAERAGDEG